MLLSVLQGSLFEGICRLMIGVTDPHLALIGIIEDKWRGWGIVPVLAVSNRWYRIPIKDPAFMGFMPDEELEVE